MSLNSSDKLRRAKVQLTKVERTRLPIDPETKPEAVRKDNAS